MPYRTIPNTDGRYFMLVVDQQGDELAKDPDAANCMLSQRLLQHLRNEAFSDLFIWIHGWKGAVPDAIDQFDRWIGAFNRNHDDYQRMLAKRPAFKACHLGFHWPSLSWGDEQVSSGNSFSPTAQGTVEERVAFHAAELGDTPAVRASLHRLFEEARTHAGADYLTDNARQAYLALNFALELGANGQAGNGSEDRETFDPDQAFDSAEVIGTDFGGLSNQLLAPLRQLTFWTMKKRARVVGERCLHRLLLSLQHDRSDLRIHLMGHSFGCIVASASLVGPEGKVPLPNAVDSCVLVQGALSHWAYASKIPYGTDVRGYFSQLLSSQKVKGPLAITRSIHDYAVGKIYPWAAGVANQVAYDLTTLPRYGAIGAHGICGVATAEYLKMLPASDAYTFKANGIYNVDASAYIKDVSDGLSGAHNDIDGKEVAHLIWEAAL
ncbi:hypothetical protein [Pseudomonas extremaustralis]|uniref:hypothetical protein n=1 Tax=Pseudomonas extremaustralis TaxID=359110 RepID=UPI002AA5E9FC|nr:hypothetical protein [Pseudomonas extremaustralis]